MAALASTFYRVLAMSIADIPQCARAAEEAGFGCIPVCESCYRDGAVMAAAITCNARTVRLGASVFPICMRILLQLAGATATVDELLSGRTGRQGTFSGFKGFPQAST